MGAGAGGQRVQRWNSRRIKCDKWFRVRSEAPPTAARETIPGGGFPIAGGLQITVKSHKKRLVGKMGFLLSCRDSFYSCDCGTCAI